jgi:hypothetical protein
MVASPTGLIPICSAASSAGYTNLYASLAKRTYVLVEGVSKAQRCSFTSLDLVLPVAATLLD